MLVDILMGSDNHTPESVGTFHFARSPEPGEHVELDGKILIVVDAWHKPSIYYIGAKFVVLVEQSDGVSDSLERHRPQISDK